MYHRKLRDDEGFLIRHFAGAVCYHTVSITWKYPDINYPILCCHFEAFRALWPVAQSFDSAIHWIKLSTLLFLFVFYLGLVAISLDSAIHWIKLSTLLFSFYPLDKALSSG